MQYRMSLMVASLISIGGLGPALAADLPFKAPPVAPAVFSWTGCYAGGNLGGKWADTSGTVNEGLVTIPGVGLFQAASLPIGGNASTFIGGGQVGCNYQTGHLVFGIEGDADAQHWNQSFTETGFFPAAMFNFVPGDHFTMVSNWQGSLRGRVGYALDRTLFYVTGGVAWTNLSVGTNFGAFLGSTATSAIDSATLTGGTVGAGVEYAFATHWTAGVEGRYTWYGSHTFNGGLVNIIGPFNSPVSQSISLNTAEVLAKINYKF